MKAPNTCICLYWTDPKPCGSWLRNPWRRYSQFFLTWMNMKKGIHTSTCTHTTLYPLSSPSLFPTPSPPTPPQHRAFLVCFVFCQRLPASFCPWDTLACCLDVEQPTNNTCQLPIYWPDEKKKSSAVRLKIIPTYNQSVVWAHWAVNLLSKWLRIFHFKCLRQWWEERVLASKASERVSWLMWMFPWNPNFYTKCCLLKPHNTGSANFWQELIKGKFPCWTQNQPSKHPTNQLFNCERTIRSICPTHCWLHPGHDVGQVLAGLEPGHHGEIRVRSPLRHVSLLTSTAEAVLSHYLAVLHFSSFCWFSFSSIIVFFPWGDKVRRREGVGRETGWWVIGDLKWFFLSCMSIMWIYVMSHVCHASWPVSCLTWQNL